MANDECRMTNQCRMANDEGETRLSACASSLSSFVIPSFVIRHWAAPVIRSFVIRYWVALALVLLAAPALAAEPRLDRKARDVFFQSGAGQAEAGKLGVKFWIALRRGETRQDVQPTHAFETGDLIRLRFQLNRDAFAYVFHEGTTGKRRLLFPNPRGNAEERLTRNATYTVPLGSAYLQFDEHKGVEKLYLIVSAKPVQDLERLIRPETPSRPPDTPPTPTPAPKLPTDLTPEENAVLKQLLDQSLPRTQRDVVFHPETAPTGAQATYAADTGANAEEPIVLEIRLEHK